MKFIGFHGTSIEKLYSIKIDGINSSKNGWFGTGSYFFLEDKELCLKWAKRKYPNKKCIAIKVEIDIDDEYILDTRLEEHRKFFHLFRDTIAQSIINGSMKYENTSQHFDNFIFDLINKNLGIKLVIANSFTFDYPKEFNSRIPNGTELCLFEKCYTIKEAYNE